MSTHLKAQANRLLLQGAQQFQTSQFEAALQSWQQALALYESINDRQGVGYALGNQGIAYHSLADYGKAIKCYKKLLKITKEIQDLSGEGAALGNLGSAYYYLGDYVKAIEYHQQYLAISRIIKERQGEAYALGNLGLAYFSLGDYEKAIEYHQQSLAIKREIKDRFGEAKALENLGIAYHALGEYGQAIECHQQSLIIKREIKDLSGEAKALGNLGIAYHALGDYDQAIEYHQQALVITRKIKDRRGEGGLLGNLGIDYFSLGNYNQAVEYHQQSFAIALEIKDRQAQGAILGGLGSAYYYLGDFTKAIEYHQQSLLIKQEVQDRRGEGNALGNLGNVYDSIGDYDKAVEYHKRSLVIAQKIQDRRGEGRALNNLGHTLLKCRNLIEAEKILITAIGLWESIRGKLGDNDAYNISIFEEQSRTYRHLQKILILKNKTDAALEIAERGRARAFVALLSKRFTAASNKKLIFNSPNIQQIKRIAKEQNSTIVEYSIIDDEFPLEGQEKSKESDLFIWVIQPTGRVDFRQVDLHSIWLQNQKSLADFVFCSRESIGVRGRDAQVISNFESQQFEEQFLRQLYNLLIQPIEELLPTDANTHVTFIPQRALFLLPFPALQDVEGKYLIEKYTIRTAPSIQVLDLTRHQQQRFNELAKQVLIVGNPTMPMIAPEMGKLPQHLRPLPGSEQEAIEIARLLKTNFLTGNKATKSAILQKMPKARIIHLATHGLLDDFKGNRVPGAIALAPYGEDEGILTTEDILSLELNAELLVLSACDTGRGRITGDGVVGLSRSFISAGVSSIVVSLWAVPDAPTAFLMKAFYQNLKNNLDKAQALRQAMLMTMKQNPNPRTWAAFTLIGEAEWALNPTQNKDECTAES